MILFDALHVNRSGGEVLLDVLLEGLLPHQYGIHFLLDDRIQGRFDHLGLSKLTYLPATLGARYAFYRDHQHRFDRVFCFSGIPPLIRTRGECLAYLQNSLLIEHPGWNQSTALKRSVQNSYMRLFGGNVDGWIVQTEHMRRITCHFFHVNSDQVMVAPFFKDPLSAAPRVRQEGTHVLYAADGYAHKNHLRLFEAFESLAIDHPDATLHVTLADRFPSLKNVVRRIQDRGVAILDHGFLQYADVPGLYAQADVVVYPSLTESLGIGLIEGAQAGLPILAADRPYVFELVEPSLTFDPLNTRSLEDAMRAAITGPLRPAVLRIRSRIEELVSRITTPIP